MPPTTARSPKPSTTDADSCLPSAYSRGVARYAGVIARRGDAVALVRESDEYHESQRWSLPSGRVEDGESDVDGAIRELREETGLVVTPQQARLVAGVDVVGRDGSVFLTASNYVADDVTGPFAIDDPDGSVLEARWFPRAEAIELVRQVPYRPIAVPVVAYLTGSVPDGTRWVFTVPHDEVTDDLADGGWTWRVDGS